MTSARRPEPAAGRGDSPFHDPAARLDAGRLGVMVFLISLSVFFAAGMIGYVVMRFTTDIWPDDLPALPVVLWVSTLLLILSSGTMQAALNSARDDRTNYLQFMMAATTLLGLAFLGMQAWAWWEWIGALGDRWDEGEGYRWAMAAFYVLTGLHAAHVIGGLIPMVVVTVRALAGRYSRQYHPGVEYCAMYWHFLGIVWIVLFVGLFLGT